MSMVKKKASELKKGDRVYVLLSVEKMEQNEDGVVDVKLNDDLFDLLYWERMGMDDEVFCVEPPLHRPGQGGREAAARLGRQAPNEDAGEAQDFLTGRPLGPEEHVFPTNKKAKS